MPNEMMDRAVDIVKDTMDAHGYDCYPETAVAIARAVIASLIEPSKAVVAIGRDCSAWLYPDEVDDMWRAMVDAILEEGKT